MDDLQKKVYAALPDSEKKNFRAAVAAGDNIAINTYIRLAGLPDLLPDDLQEDFYKKNKYDIHKQFHNMPDKLPALPNNNIDNTLQEKTTAGGVDGLAAFEKKYTNIIDNTCRSFYDIHPDLVKKTPFMWYNSLLYELKKVLPSINISRPEVVGVAWDCFCNLMYKIGLFPTMEAFTCLTGIYKDTLNRQLSPEYIELKKKIYNDCKDHLQAQVTYNPMTQVNKMFILKSVYGYSENNVNSDLVAGLPDRQGLNVDDIPLFDSVDDL